MPAGDTGSSAAVIVFISIMVSSLTMGKTLQIVIVVLVAIAAGLVYLISIQSNEKIATIPSASPQQSETSAPSSETQSPLSPLSSSPTPQAGPISAKDHKAILAFPNSKASADERAAYNALVNRLARDANTLLVSGCSPDPLVMHVLLAKDFTITNTDSVKRRVFFQEPTIEIPPNGSVIIHPAKVFTHGAGNYGYFCDGSSDINGVFLVTP